LAQQRIPVKLLVTFDPVPNMAVEGDIARVVNLYISDGWGTPVARGPRFRGTLVNMDLRNRSDGRARDRAYGGRTEHSRAGVPSVWSRYEGRQRASMEHNPSTGALNLRFCGGLRGRLCTPECG
jgi:hypothetical protein